MARPKARNRPPSQQSSQQPNQPSKPWDKMSFATVTATPPPPPNSTPSEVRRISSLPEVHSQGSLGPGSQAASPLNPSLIFFPYTQEEEVLNPRAPYPSFWCPPSVHCEQATGSDVSHRKFPPSVYSFRAGGKFTDKKCLSTVTTQFAQITSHTHNKGSVPFVCSKNKTKNKPNIESDCSSKHSCFSGNLHVVH